MRNNDVILQCDSVKGYFLELEIYRNMKFSRPAVSPRLGLCNVTVGGKFWGEIVRMEDIP